MAYVQWPATLPGPKFPAGQEWGDTRLLSDAESGLRQVRRRFTQVPDRVKLKFILPPPSAYLDFRAFVETNLKDGALWFQAPWLGTLGYEHHAARFVSMPTYRSIDGRVWEAQAEIEIRDAGFADDAGLPSPNHDPAVQSGPISPFEGEVYRFYDDFSTYQGWTLEAGGAPTHDAAAGTLTLPANSRISKPIAIDPSLLDTTAGKLTIRLEVQSNSHGHSGWWTFPAIQAIQGIWLTDDTGDGYAVRIDTSGSNPNTYIKLYRVDAGTLTQLNISSTFISGHNASRASLFLCVAEGHIAGICRYFQGYQPISSHAQDADHSVFSRVHIETGALTTPFTAIEVEAS